MPFDVLVALATFALVSSVTPGPNNMMLMTSGVNFGFRRTIPHILGIEIGFGLLLLAVGAGLGALIHAVPALSLVMKAASALYLLWLAWKIAFAKAAAARDETGEAKPISLAQAALFQVVNPKAWAMALVAMGAYVSDDMPVLSVAIVTAAFLVVGIPSAAIWTGFGVALRGFLADPKRLRIFNIVMGLLLVATLWPMLR
ncbi:lysine transporter LysE [Aureimonas endophytica]|uniref:Lysine transporter LysE n=1 Tax=Aureimonas endophytica TaxID=2027858 RepID=A0A917E275_9HYPH|nr:LysE family translocator [Aureimonas endophytica]GGD91923.1 lysine transporter LysE [Aureimonas endophytica]